MLFCNRVMDSQRVPKRLLALQYCPEERKSLLLAEINSSEFGILRSIVC